MTKVDAIEQVMLANGGSASLSQIYDQIEKFYPTAKQSATWDAGIRGVLYRELRQGSRFKKIGLSIYAVNGYQEEKVPKMTDKVRAHSFMEGICLELGNVQKFKTYTADPSMLYRDNTHLCDIATLRQLPEFSYPEIVKEAKLVDVLWMSDRKLSFPQYAFEVVDSIGTLEGAFKRCMQMHNFRTRFFIVAPEKHRKKFEQTIDLEIYYKAKELFSFISYDMMLETYGHVVKGETSLSWL